MRRKSRIVLIAFLAILMAVPVTAFAALENIHNNYETSETLIIELMCSDTDYIVNRLNNLDFGFYGAFYIPEARALSFENVLDFETIEEAEAFFNNMAFYVKQLQDTIIEIYHDPNTSQLISSSAEFSTFNTTSTRRGTASFWAPHVTTFGTMNIDYTYTVRTEHSGAFFFLREFCPQALLILT